MSGALLVASFGCGADTERPNGFAPQPTRTQLARIGSPQKPAVRSTGSGAVVPRIPADRGIRRELNLGIVRDHDLKHRGISFIVSKGDVNVTGVVRTEGERKRINELALSIPGVKSVANSLRISP